MVNWMSYGIDGFAYAAESMVGKYKGKNDLRKLNYTIKLSLLWGAAFAALFSILYFIFYNDIFSLFVDFDKYSIAEISEIQRLSDTFRWWMVLFPIAGFLCYIWDGIYIGLTASKSMRNATFISFALYLIFYYLSLNKLGEHAIWLALFIFLIGRGLIQSYLYKMKGIALD
jgi:MATE family multidrug resistance protein